MHCKPFTCIYLTISYFIKKPKTLSMTAITKNFNKKQKKYLLTKSYLYISCYDNKFFTFFKALDNLCLTACSSRFTYCQISSYDCDSMYLKIIIWYEISSNCFMARWIASIWNDHWIDCNISSGFEYSRLFTSILSWISLCFLKWSFNIFLNTAQKKLSNLYESSYLSMTRQSFR